MSGDEDYPPDDRAKATKAAIGARLTAFDRHEKGLLRHLQNVCECPPKTKSFDSDTAWRDLRLHAWSYLQQAVRREMAPNIDRVKELRQLEKVLRGARTKLEDVRGPVFVEWCEANGNPDFLDPSIAVYEDRFDALLEGVADLGMAASRAAEYMRRKPGKPRGTGPLQPDFVVRLEQAYRSITGKQGTASRGQFAQFIVKFMGALGCRIEIEAAVKVIVAAKKSERWGRSFFGRMGGKNSP